MTEHAEEALNLTRTGVGAASHDLADAGQSDDAISAFLWDEAFLLDHRRYEEWLELWDPDGFYWAPIVPGSDPDKQVSLIYDDMSSLRVRVQHLLSDDGWVQVPPSSVVRTVSNIRITGVAGSRLDVRSVEFIAEWRRGELTFWPAHVEHQLLALPEGGYRIQRKVVELVNSADVLPNVGIIL